MIQLEMNPRKCGCICHQVGLFGLMCCQCSRDAIVRALDELANGKTSMPVAPIAKADEYTKAKGE